MKRAILMVGLMCFLGTNVSFADIVATTSTLDSAYFDFDGAGSETSGSFNTATQSFVLTGSQLPNDSEFESITSLTVSFQSAGAGMTSLSGIAGGINQPGIGVATSGETIPDYVGSLGGAAGESLSVSVTSTSTNGDFVTLTGVEFVSWRNFFPFSEVELSSATFGGGQTLFTGMDGSNGPLPILSFDNPTNLFQVAGLGEPIRIANIRLGVSSAVPEPGMTGLLGLGILGGIFRRRRR